MLFISCRSEQKPSGFSIISHLTIPVTMANSKYSQITQPSSSDTIHKTASEPHEDLVIGVNVDEYSSSVTSTRRTFHRLPTTVPGCSWAHDRLNSYPTDSRLLNLPLELREMVYLEVFRREEPDGGTNSSALLCTCQSIYAEAQDSYYSGQEQICLKICYSRNNGELLTLATPKSPFYLAYMHHILPAFKFLRSVALEIIDVDHVYYVDDPVNLPRCIDLYDQDTYQDFDALLAALPCLEELAIICTHETLEPHLNCTHGRTFQRLVLALLEWPQRLEVLHFYRYRQIDQGGRESLTSLIIAAKARGWYIYKGNADISVLTLSKRILPLQERRPYMLSIWGCTRDLFKYDDDDDDDDAYDEDEWEHDEYGIDECEYEYEYDDEEPDARILTTRSLTMRSLTRI